MKTGVLVPQKGTDRMDIRFSLTEYYGGLHCGDVFDVKVNGKWIPTRIEMSYAGEWYLVDTPYKGNLEYVKARI